MDCSTEIASFSPRLIHHVPDLIDKTAALISDEWPRGLSARVTSLKASNDDFPVNIILISKDEDVVAHCRLSKVSDDPSGILIETVVVKKALRGHGLGKRIMTEAESFVKGHDFSTLYLSTHDKQEFYKHIGFEECSPVSSLGANGAKFSAAQLSGLLSAFGGNATQSNDKRTWMKKNLA
jgi:N-acetylglutamate synthase-like GNAT family acetyltransferase